MRSLKKQLPRRETVHCQASFNLGARARDTAEARAARRLVTKLRVAGIKPAVICRDADQLAP
jgi:hypothetical protein